MKRLMFVIVVLSLLVVPAVSAQDDVIEIDFVHIFSDDLRPLVIESIAADFMAENPGIVVNTLAVVGEEDYGETFNAALRAADQGDAYNIVQVEGGLTQQAIDSQYFVPVSDYASEEQIATLDDILPPVRAYYAVGDAELWAMPWNISNPLLYYNKDMFVAAGLDPDDPPATFDEVVTACEALMSTEALDLPGCINWPVDTWFIEEWMAMQNVLLVNNDNGRSARATEVFFDSPEMVEAMTWWGDLAEAGYYTYGGTVGAAAFRGEGISFLSGQTAMTITSSAGLTLFLQFAPFELGAGQLIKPSEDADNGVTIGGGSVWLSADQSEEELQASVDFIFYLTNTINSAIWHVGSGYLPIRESSIEYLQNLEPGNALFYDLDAGERVDVPETNWFELNPFYLIPVEQLAESEANVATAGAVIGPSDVVRGYLISAFQSVIDAGADPAEALAAAKAQADEALADYNRDVE